MSSILISGVLMCLGIAVSTSEPASSTAGKDPVSVKSQYWPTTQQSDIYVTIDGYGFDFEPPKRSLGVVDGPWSHNGKYRILENVPGILRMKIHFGTDRYQKNDMDVILKIVRGRVTAIGSVKGQAFGELKARIQKKRGKYSLSFAVKDSSGVSKTHSIKWDVL